LRWAPEERSAPVIVSSYRPGRMTYR
jgi:hypothetical protein